MNCTTVEARYSSELWSEGEDISRIPVCVVEFAKYSEELNEHTSKLEHVLVTVSPRTFPFWSFILIMSWPDEIFVQPFTSRGAETAFSL